MPTRAPGCILGPPGARCELVRHQLPSEAAPGGNMSSCLQCGAELIPGASACGACGANVTSADAQADRASASAIFTHVPHPYIARRKHKAPVMLADMHPRENAMQRFNAFLALRITGGVGTMWCAYLFGLLALISLP